MKIVFLSSSHAPHQILTINDFQKLDNVEVFNFNLEDPLHDPGLLDSDHLFNVREVKKEDILSKLKKIKPDIMVVAGWSSKKFMWVSKKIRQLYDIPVVVASDTQWLNTFRQKINRLIAPVYIHKSFTHIWVAGIYQFEYARQLGFAKKRILYNSLSCENKLFERSSIEIKEGNYPKNFIFVGRFVAEKGLGLLSEAWKGIKDKKGWTLTLVGEGESGDLFRDQADVFFKDYMQQEEIPSEFEKAGCFVITSVFEQWSVAIHEAASSALPIIATNACGACPHFVIDNFNGFQTEVNSESIRAAMEKIISLDEKELLRFSGNSRHLSRSITRELGIAQILSIL